ncbi:Single-stranded-DNA-specific exonuclease RecJ [Candidatus Cyrtobacter comes]|uniref:Single-stranded-DNA-specific exonuclease RecJ n=2 Tax=Candidatus Cyrtobacter comes TaxID=675776 RepID=A0ABU5L9M4_9RICK|nr:Single-stranded-DNA-specific exonuclease RecJ [Candidatus Cyrtobacter comes]
MVSMRNLKWSVKKENERVKELLKQKLKISDILSKLLVNRHILSEESANLFLKAKLYDTLPSPFILQDMQKAVARTADAILSGQKITIFADYDVDGASSAAVLFKFLEKINFKPDVYIPDRIKEGYGPSKIAFEQIIKKGADLIITLDCGVSAHEPIELANSNDIDVIVIDHHMVPDILPNAHSIINPKRPDDLYPYKEIAAVTVTFLFIIALKKELVCREYLKEDIDLMQFLDLVALGTICDVMPLININRIFVKKGLSLINKRQNKGIAELIDISNIKNKITESHICYALGPRINAGGRLSRSELGTMLLTSNDYLKARSIAIELNKLNLERREIEKAAVEEAVQYIESQIKDGDPLVFAYGEWYIGIVGIIASRLKDKYKRPAVVISCKEDGSCSGSARSIPGVDFGKIINLAKDNFILLTGGGHAMAGGFSLKKENIEKFKEYIIERILKYCNASEALELASFLDIDMLISTSAVNESILVDIEALSPFGPHNEIPKFAILDVKLQCIDIKTDNFARLKVSDVFMGSSVSSLYCSIFIQNTDEMKRLQDLLGKNVSISGYIQRDRSDRADFIIEDIIYEQL